MATTAPHPERLHRVHLPSLISVRTAVRQSWLARHDAPWICFVAVPLAMNAAGLMQIWWLMIPLIACAVIVAPSWRWSWVLTIQLGLVGTEWAYLGCMALVMWPDHRYLIGLFWAGVAIGLAVAGMVNRRYAGRVRSPDHVAGTTGALGQQTSQRCG